MTDESTNADKSDRTAEFVRLLKQHDRRLAAYVHASVPDWNEAEDIVQDACVRLWEQFDKFDPDSNFGAWACTVARYLILASRKRSKRGHLYLRDEVLDAMGAEFDRVQPEVASRLEAVKHCVEELPAEGRELLHVCYSEDMQLSEVAVELDRSVGSLYTAVSRLRRQVHDCVERRLRQEEHS